MYPGQRESEELLSEDDIPVFTPLPSPLLSVAMSTAYLTPKPSVEGSVNNDDAVLLEESSTPPADRVDPVRDTQVVHNSAVPGFGRFITKMPLRRCRAGLVLLVGFLLGHLVAPDASSRFWRFWVEVAGPVVVCFGVAFVVLVVWRLFSLFLMVLFLMEGVCGGMVDGLLETMGGEDGMMSEDDE